MATAPSTYRNSAGIELKLFKDVGTVIMGSERGEIGRNANEFIREVRLSKPFYAGIYEVSVEQYRQYASQQASTASGRTPITGIEWVDAAKFCNWLSDKEGFAKVYRFTGEQFTGSDQNADGYRLLTEPEWEWLARKSGRQRQSTYPWGDVEDPRNFSGNLADASAKGAAQFVFAEYNDSAQGVAEIGAYSPNAAGIHDLAGNVSEWTHDSYHHRQPVPGTVELDAFDSSAAPRRTIKGSNWKSGNLNELRAAWKEGSTTARDTVGFRVARYLYGGN